MNPSLQPGSPAPHFTAPVTGGEFPDGAVFDLAALRGETVVLYFYPKDDTPGCTKQACALRDGWAAVRARAKVFGVSTDSLQSHAKFIAKYALPFPLISDAGHAAAAAYGVWVEKKLYGKSFMGMERTTVVIGPDGLIHAVLPKVKPEAHFDLLLAALSASPQ